MRLSVNIVIYFYIFICAVLLLFNLLTILRSARVKRRQKRRVRRWKTYLSLQKEEAYARERQRILTRKMERTRKRR